METYWLFFIFFIAGGFAGFIISQTICKNLFHKYEEDYHRLHKKFIDLYIQYLDLDCECSELTKNSLDKEEEN